MTHSPTECCFCAELAGRRTRFHELYPDLNSRVVLESDDFVVVPSLGQLSPGHLLLIPRQHVTSFGALGSTYREEALRIYDLLRSELGQRYSPPVSFEHGSPPGATEGGCGIVHAHIHFVPSGSVEMPQPPAAGTGWLEGSSHDWLDRAAEVSGRRSGYLMWHGRTPVACLDPVMHVSSQYLRKHVAANLGRPSWDWRRIGRQEGIARLVESASRKPLHAGAAPG